MGNSVAREKYLPQVPDLTGYVVVVTGGNSGIGFEAASVFIEKGATVVLACRSQTNAEKAVADLKERHAQGNVSYLILDASSKASIEKFIQDFTAKYDKLNILVNNAGVAKNPKDTPTDFGTDFLYTVNIIAPYLLSLGLLDHLERGSTENGVASRIVTVSSLAADNSKDVDYANWGGKKKAGMKRYGESKLGVMMMSNALNRKIAKAQKKTFSLTCHPGFARSKMSKQVVGDVVGKLAQSPFMGSLPTVMAATSDNAVAGSFVGPKRSAWGVPVIKKNLKPELDETKQDKIWTKLVEVTGKDLQ